MSETPKLAATVVVLRDVAPGSAEEGKVSSAFEIFFLRRHRASAFMGGAYVFPGGKLDEADSAVDLLNRTAGRSELACAELLGHEQGAGLFVAGIRETFEEAGALLVSAGDSDAPLALDDAATEERFAGHRAGLNERKTAFVDVVAAEGLTLHLDRLHYWGHWITPEIESRRYDTFFFVARVPPGQQLVHDTRETVESLWLTPQDALRQHADAKLLLMPPTLRNVEMLAEHATVADVFAASDRADTPPICPTFQMVDEQPALLMPGDPLYQLPDSIASHPLAGGGLGGPTRFLLQDGIWITAFAS